MSDEETPKPTRGIKTTEFWLSLAAVVGGFILSSGLLVEGGTAATITGAIVAGLAALGYTASRGKVKSGK
jgi:hypothetical protein